jgi:hypothetical protein
LFNLTLSLKLLMTTNFVTFYLILVLITGPFFQFIPISTESLLWNDILLGKILNQAPTVFLLIYIIFQTKKPQFNLVFILLISFLASCIIPELYYYFVNPDNVFLTIVAHNAVSYLILISLFYFKSKTLQNTDRNVFLPASLAIGLITVCFIFSIYHIYVQYFQAHKLIFLVLNLFIVTAILVVVFSFFTEKPFQRTWYEIVVGVFLMVCVDIYTFTCMFVFDTIPTLLYTVGKIFFSVGVLFLVDGILRKRFDLNVLEKH